MSFRSDPSGFYVCLDTMSAIVRDKVKKLAKVYATVGDNNPLVKRAKAAGRTVRGPSFVVTYTTNPGNFTWIPRTWIEEQPEFIQFRSPVLEHRRAAIARTTLPTNVFTPTFTLKASQVDVLREVFEHGPVVTSGCLALHTGFGKTVVALELIRRLNVRTLWLSHTSQLIRQFSERAQSFLGTTVGDLTEPDLGGTAPIVSCTIQSLLRREIPMDVIGTFGLVIIDEVHHMGAESFSQAFHKVGGIAHTIGLSATLERKDGLAHVFQWSIGKILSVRELVVTVPPIVKIVQGCWNVDIVMNKNGDPMFAQAVTDLTRLDAYNDTILRVLVDVLEGDDGNRRVLLLTDRKEHILILDAMLHQRQIANVGALHGNLTAKQMNETLSNPHIRVYLATYGIAGEGFDCPGLNCVLMATPRNDVRQSVGRILGERTTSVRPLIVDIRNTMGLFFNQGRERIKYYRAAGFDVHCENAVSAAAAPAATSATSADIAQDTTAHDDFIDDDD
jgi:superfamily II DNA or RNA helicase